MKEDQFSGLSHLKKLVSEAEESRKRDAIRFAEVDKDLCMCCHAHGEDKRSLWVDCFYAVSEVIPEAINISGVDPKPSDHQHGYYMRICKSCRSRFLSMIGEWWEEGVARRGLTKDHDGYVKDDSDPERNIPVRVNGAIVMLTRSEWDERVGG